MIYKLKILNRATALRILFLFFAVATQAQNLTWMKGSNSFNELPVYGTMGVPSTNNTPGARTNPATWKDQNGDLWLFGGLVPSGTPPTWLVKNDLWKYNVTTDEWTWMHGSTQVSQYGVSVGQCLSDPTNTPGARRHAQTWTDASGNLWLYGGVGFALTGNGDLGDLWKYEVATNQWTNISGGFGSSAKSTYGTQGVAAPGNKLGSRRGAVSWSDPKGNMWLFGGLGFDKNNNYGSLNEVWRFDPVTKIWTWMGGKDTYHQTGKYGTLGVPSTTNMPGSRSDCSWAYDVDGNLLLFGGSGHDISSTFNSWLNDLWRFNPSTNEWTWIGGSTTGNQFGIYGTQGVPSPANMPGARTSSAFWADGEGKFYLFGGYGFSSSSGNELNDLWMYNSSASEWTWLNGSNLAKQPGTYGTMGVASPGNIPAARGSAANWLDNSGDLWLFGGYIANSNTLTNYSDLWKISICSSSSVPTVSASSSPATLTSGQAATLTASGAVYYSWNGMYSGVVSSVVFNPVAVGTASTNTVAVTGWDANGCASTALVIQTVNAIPILSVTSTASLICAGQTVTLSVTGSNSYTWNTTGVGSQTVVSPPQITTYTVATKDAAGCINSAIFTQSVAACVDAEEVSNKDLRIGIFPNPGRGSFIIEKDNNLAADLYISDLNGTIIHQSTIESNNSNIDLSQESEGVYFVHIKEGTRVSVKKFVLLK